MYVDIEKIMLLKFNNCQNCNECCKNKIFAPLILEDFEKVYNYFPIVFIELNEIKPAMLLSNKESCPYLKNNKCSIYENRPPACKIYPFSPWYDKILLDLSCKGVGIQGDYLPLTKKEFVKSKFFDERIINIKEKISRTQKWLKEKELIYIGKINQIKIFKLKTINDKYDKMHQKSLKFLDFYLNSLEK